MNSWIDVSSQWKQGILYPRWAHLAQWGFGEARFTFYPPASWTLGALLGVILPWRFVPVVYIWIVLTLSGCSMFILARNWLGRRDAVFAAVLYAVNPYYLIVVYWRSAFAELLAGALLPLLVLYVLRLERDGRRAALPLALVCAAAWLTNVPAAVMVNFSLLLLLVVQVWLRRDPRVVLWAGFAAGLGAGLAAFYLVPVVFEQSWVQIAQVLSPGVRPQDNFLFTHTADLDHYRFNLLVSLAAAWEIILVAAAAFYSRRWKKRAPRLWWALAAWGAVAAGLTFRFTSLGWRFLPVLRYVQLPWRWLLCLNVVFALLAAMAWKRWPMRLLVYGAMLVALGFGWHRLQPPWWDTKLDIAEMVENQRTGIGYEGTDEYLPAGADPYEVKHDAPQVTFTGKVIGNVQVQRWAPETKAFIAKSASPAMLALHLFNFPAWQVEVNGHIVSAQSEEATGQMLIPVEAGENQVRVTFLRTWDRTLGGIVSLGSTILAIILGVQRFKPRQSKLVAH